MVAKEIENAAHSIQLVQHDNFAGLSRHEVSLGAEQRNIFCNCALGALECLEFLERELNVIQFAVVVFNKWYSPFIYCTIIVSYILRKSRRIFVLFRRTTSKRKKLSLKRNNLSGINVISEFF